LRELSRVCPLRSQHHFRHDVIVLLFVFCFLSICDRLTWWRRPEGLVVVSSLVLAYPAKPPAFIRQSRMKAGGGLAAATGRHITHRPRFSLICNDALAANRFPRGLGGGGARHRVRRKRRLTDDAGINEASAVRIELSS
jgi:hypothetical protein